MDNDRLDWILNTDATGSLETRYDEWAATYDADHDEWGWKGPDMVAEAVLRLGGGMDDSATIVDAGCGTGKAGIALRKAGWPGRLLGLDLSQGMLDVAAASGVYDELIKCSLLEIPLPAHHAGAVVSSGVFTEGHVGGEAFAELCRITRPDGIVTITERVDYGTFFRGHADELAANGAWEEVERSEPDLFHPDRDDTEQVVISWRVLT